MESDANKVHPRDHELISFYLRKQGWIRIESNRPGIEIFIEPRQSEPFEIILPKKENVSGYPGLIADAVRILSESEQLEPKLLTKKIRNIDRDFHNYRIFEYTEGVASEVVALELITQLLNCTREMLIKASRYEYSASYYSKPASERRNTSSPADESEKFIKGCEFAHTWQGSFGITIQIPLWLTSLGLLDDIPETLGRKTTNRTIMAYKVISDAVAKGSCDYIVDHISKDEILMFESFPEIQETLKRGQIQIEVEMSPTIKPKEDILSSRRTVIDRKALSYIEKAVEQVKAPENELEIELLGFPKTISATRQDLLDLEQGERKVVVDGISRQIDRVSLKMELSMDDYKKAIKAQDEVRNVRVKCKVRRNFRRWEVVKVMGFDLL